MRLDRYTDRLTIGDDCDECCTRAPELTIEEVDELIARLQTERRAMMTWRQAEQLANSYTPRGEIAWFDAYTLVSPSPGAPSMANPHHKFYADGRLTIEEN